MYIEIYIIKHKILPDLFLQLFISFGYKSLFLKSELGKAYKYILRQGSYTGKVSNSELIRTFHAIKAIVFIINNQFHFQPHILFNIQTYVFLFSGFDPIMI